MPTSAAAVATRLRRAGIMTVPDHREGVRVSRGWRRGLVQVVVSLDNPRHEIIIGDAIADEVSKWDGFTFERNPQNESIFTIEKKD